MKTIEEQIHELKFKGEEFNVNDFRDWAMENSDEAYKLCLQVANFKNNNLALSKGDVSGSLPFASDEKIWIAFEKAYKKYRSKAIEDHSELHRKSVIEIIKDAFNGNYR